VADLDVQEGRVLDAAGDDQDDERDDGPEQAVLGDLAPGGDGGGAADVAHATSPFAAIAASRVSCETSGPLAMVRTRRRSRRMSTRWLTRRTSSNSDEMNSTDMPS